MEQRQRTKTPIQNSHFLQQARPLPNHTLDNGPDALPQDALPLPKLTSATSTQNLNAHLRIAQDPGFLSVLTQQKKNDVSLSQHLDNTQK